MLGALPDAHPRLLGVDELDDQLATVLDGHSLPPYDPAMMVALLYADARGIRSSRVIERACDSMRQ